MSATYELPGITVTADDTTGTVRLTATTINEAQLLEEAGTAAARLGATAARGRHDLTLEVSQARVDEAVAALAAKLPPATGAGLTYRHARHRLDQAQETVARAVTDHGATKLATAAAAGITRQTLDRWLGDWTRTSEHLTA